ncbi:MAG: peptidylprolyl isomerase [Gammaproteobacteria bacterium]|nr:peptidylprolyl isomerase [Gammaproteobacteria bacterium]MCW9058457.1 peptidylprolyl isomerase [Gammaproteobacteria bacterium]
MTALPSLLALLAGLLLSLPGQAEQALNRIVAVVNDGVVLQSQLDRRTDQIRQQLLERDTRLPPMDVLRKQVLERLILEEIQLQLAASMNIRIEDELLNANLRQMAEANNLDLAGFRQALEAEGYSFTEFRDEVRKQLIIARLHAQQVENRIQVSEQEIENLLTSQEQGADDREYLLSHILVALPEAASPQQIQEAQARTERLLERLRAGEEFSQMAVAESDGQQALEGGSLGWRKASQLPSLFADVARNLERGEISEPIRSASGFHIVRMDDLRGGDERHVITQTHARHILLRPDELQSAAQVENRLLQLRRRIEGGDDFETLARAHSQDAVSAARGGDLGWSNPGDLVPEFEKEMSQLQPGEVSPPFESRFGWHIVQVLERRERDSTEEFRRAEAREQVRQRKIQEESASWMRRLRDESYVDYRLEDA